MKLKPILIIVATAIAVVAGGAALFAKQHAANDEKKKPAPVATTKPALTVTTTRPSATNLPIKLTANGNIMAWQEASVGAEANGLRLTEVRVNVGDQVERGQVLAKFAEETIQADVAQAQANLAEAEANAQESAANGDRARRLQPTGAISAQQINQYLTAEQAGKARVQAARATLNSQQLRMKHTLVIAPDSGVISARMATVGAVVSGGTELFRIIRQSRLEWRAEVMSEELGRLSPGTVAIIAAANGAQMQGRVRIVAPTVDPQTRAALVYVNLPKDSGATAGMFATGQFELGSSDALTVPQQAVVMRDGFTYVFAVNADHRVAQVKVATGRRLGDRVEITNGMKPDTIIVAGGAGFLNDGDLVKDLPQAPTPTASVLDR
jgi:RND family efflux transporter MFP subunit